MSINVDDFSNMRIPFESRRYVTSYRFFPFKGSTQKGDKSSRERSYKGVGAPTRRGGREHR